MTETTVYNPTTTASNTLPQQLPFSRNKFKYVTISFGVLFIILGSVVTFVGLWGEEISRNDQDQKEDSLERVTNWLVTVLGILLFVCGVVLTFFYFRIRPNRLLFTKARIVEAPIINDLQLMQSNTEEKANLMSNEAKDGLQHTALQHYKRRFHNHGENTRKAPLAILDDFPSVHSSFASVYIEGWDQNEDDNEEYETTSEGSVHLHYKDKDKERFNGFLDNKRYSYSN